MAQNRKFYVVWVGRAPGIYDNWDDCREQVEGFEGARFKSYTSQDAATEAFRGNPDEQLAMARELGKHIGMKIDYTLFPEIRLDAIAVDGALGRKTVGVRGAHSRRAGLKAVIEVVVETHGVEQWVFVP